MITEPMTLLTDWVLAGLCIVFGWRIHRSGPRGKHRSRRLLALFFLATAIGAFAGGAEHGFSAALGPRGSAWMWKCALASLGVSLWCFLAAAGHAYLKGRNRRLLMVAASVQCLAYLICALSGGGYFWVLINAVPAMAFVLLLAIPSLRAGSQPARWLTAGLIVSFVAAGVQASGFTLHQHFNHNDLYHVLQMFGLWAMYRGGLELRDRQVAVR